MARRPGASGSSTPPPRPIQGPSARRRDRRIEVTMSIFRAELIRADADARSSRLPLRGILQVVGVTWAYILYGGFRNLATGPTVVSLRDAERILSVERFLH